MKPYIHFGFPRTATTTSQIHLFPNHPQINYLGRYPKTKPKLELIDLINNLNNDDFDKRYNELLKKTEELYLDPNKTNIISYEYIIWNAIHYDDPYHNPDPNDIHFRTVPRTVSRINSLFSEIDVEVYFFCSIRNQSDMIRSAYNVTSPELGASMTFAGEEIIQYLKTKNTNKPKIKRLLNGYNYCELYKNLSKVVGENKIKFFLYEEFKNRRDDFVSDLSNYLKIDPAISIKLLKYRHENSVKEIHIIESPLPVLCFKLIKNFKSPKILFENFNKKLLNMFKLLNQQIRKFDKKDKEVIKIKKENLIKQLNVIKNNSPLIKKYYRNDCLELKNKLKLDIDKYDYF